MDLKTFFDESDLTQVALAKELDVEPGAVWQWVNGVRPIPVPRCYAIHRWTGGKVTLKDLRPEDWRQIWPELEAA